MKSSKRSIPATCRLAPEALDDLDAHAEALGLTRAALLERVLTGWLEEHPLDDLTRRRIDAAQEERRRSMEKMGLDAHLSGVKALRTAA